MDIPEVTKRTFDVDLLMQTSRILWGEASYEGLIRKFVSFLKERLAIKDLSVIALPDPATAKASAKSPDKPNWTRSPLALDGVQGLSDDVIAELVRQVAAVGITSPDLREGITLVQIGGHEISLAVVVEPSGGAYVIAWHALGDLEPQTRRGLSPPLRANCPKELLEFVVRQLQCQCTWFGLLDRTQSMLYRDELTGLFNYRYLEIAVDAEMRRAQRFLTGFSLLFVDLDDFKSVNDRFGHLVGSDVLKQVATVLLGSVREVDSVIRYGGDEYVVVLLGANTKTALVAAERIRSRIARHAFQVDTRGADGEGAAGRSTLSLTVSIGAASYPEHGKDKESLLHMADQGMYRGKKSGKNRVVVLNPSDGQMEKPGASAGDERL